MSVSIIAADSNHSPMESLITRAVSPACTAAVISYNTKTLHRNDTPEPIATSVSMFGAPWIMPLKPFMKNLRFMNITTIASSISEIPTAAGFPSRNGGSVAPNILCPIEMYMR